MAKYHTNDKFKLRHGNDTVKLRIIFVPELDGEGNQYYLCEVFSVYANGGDKHFYSLKPERDIEEHFVLR